MRNPPQWLRDTMGEDFDFSGYPAADDDCFIQVNMFAASDDSNQSAYTVGCVMETTYTTLKESFPWITKAVIYSDQCGDYHSTLSLIFNHEIGRLTGIRIILCAHTEVGEGKSEVDMRFGQLMQRMNKHLGKVNRRDAAELFQNMEKVRSNGDRNLNIAINRSRFKSGTSGAIPLLSQCQSYEFPEGGGVIIREVYGYGEGIFLSKEDLMKYDHYGIIDSVGTGTYVIDESVGKQVPMRRHTYEGKREAKINKDEQSASKKRKSANIIEMNATLLKKVEPKSERVECGECGRGYCNQSFYSKHKADGRCDKYREDRQAKEEETKRRGMKAEAMICDRRADAAKVELAVANSLDEESFTFMLRADRDAIKFTSCDKTNAVLVKKVDASRIDLACTILPKYKVSSILVDGVDVPFSNVDGVTNLIVSEIKPIEVIFIKPDGVLPRHGYARKHPCTSQTETMTKTQLKFLEEICQAYKDKNQVQPRYMVVHKQMVEKYGALKLDKKKRVIVLHPTKIFNWLKTRAAQDKEKDKCNAGIALASIATQRSITNRSPRANEETDYSERSVAELKVLLRDLHLSETGNKSALIARLVVHAESERSQSGDRLVKFENKTVDQLKALLRNISLSVTGNKTSLIDRLQIHTHMNKSVMQLKASLGSLGLDQTGTKSALKARLMEAEKQKRSRTD